MKRAPSNRRRRSQSIIALANQERFFFSFEVSSHYMVDIDGSNNTHLFKKPVDFKKLGMNNLLIYEGQSLVGGEVVTIYDYD